MSNPRDTLSAEQGNRRDSLEPEINAEWERLPEIEKLRRNVIYWMEDSFEKQKRNYELRQELLRERERSRGLVAEVEKVREILKNTPCELAEMGGMSALLFLENAIAAYRASAKG